MFIGSRRPLGHNKKVEVNNTGGGTCKVGDNHIGVLKGVLRGGPGKWGVYRAIFGRPLRSIWPLVGICFMREDSDPCFTCRLVIVEGVRGNAKKRLLRNTVGKLTASGDRIDSP